MAHAVFPDALPVLPLSAKWQALLADVIPGQPNSLHAPAVLASIDQAIELVHAGKAAGVVTNPIQKSTLYQAGFSFPGHTEYLAHLAAQRITEGLAQRVAGEAGQKTTEERVIPVMMLVTPGLRVVPVTIHVSLHQAIAALTEEAIWTCGRITAAALQRDFALAAPPRLAVAGLNPHAGEDGAMGDEEIRIISPAIRRLQAEGILARGPLAPDTLFHDEARAGYDAVLCMYHDQALIPLKTLNFMTGVNITLGLPFIRTSPDHGTALTLAGSGRANPSSLCAALGQAETMAIRRDKPWISPWTGS
jgi:4-hydroxythreonine-4-phosphate dehydrogenase